MVLEVAHDALAEDPIVRGLDLDRHDVERFTQTPNERGRNLPGQARRGPASMACKHDVHAAPRFVQHLRQVADVVAGGVHHRHEVAARIFGADLGIALRVVSRGRVCAARAA
jgi:hypothetical protein